MIQITVEVADEDAKYVPEAIGALQGWLGHSLIEARNVD